MSSVRKVHEHFSIDIIENLFGQYNMPIANHHINKQYESKAKNKRKKMYLVIPKEKKYHNWNVSVYMHIDSIKHDGIT